jgi:homocitrate synthase NifV
MSQVTIVDTTLRDGEQAAGLAFPIDEKIEIALFLDQIGVPEIEVGIPAMGGEEKEAIQTIVSLQPKAKVLAWNRILIPDIEASLAAGVKAVAISIAVSDIHIKHKLRKDRQWVLIGLEKAISFAKRYGLYVCVGAEDASRADPRFLYEVIRVAEATGANRFRYCDTLGILSPFETYARIKHIQSITDLKIEIHTHNDFGMATANAIAGIKAGATHVSTTVLGLGERAGNAAIEEVVMALKYQEGIELPIVTQQLRAMAEYVAKASGKPIPPWKPIVGDSISSHEAGIHVDGMIKNPLNYEPFDPAEVGMQRRLVIGKHSGTNQLRAKFQSLGIDLKKEEAQRLLSLIRAVAINKKGSISEEEILQLYRKGAQSL